MGLVSIIVPVFNTNNVLNKCIESIIMQSYPGIEVILIDDGSTDGSGGLCDEWEKKDSRIRVIHQSNQGVTSARMAGIKECKGEFITFVDSDDWIDERFIEAGIVAFNSYSDVDIFIGGMKYDSTDGNSRIMGICGEDGLFSAEEAIEEMFRYTFFKWELCGKMYRRFLFNGFDIDKSIIVGEDLDSNWKLFHKADKVFFSCKHFYHYVQNPNSAMIEQDYVKENSMTVFNRILNSEYRVSYFIKTYIKRLEILLIARKIRAMYLQDPNKYENEIDLLADRFVEYTDLYPDVMKAHRDVEGILRLPKSDRDRLFHDEYCKICDAVEKAQKYKKIYIYGIGAAGEYVLRAFKNQELHSISFVVSDEKYTKELFWKHRVFKLSQIEPDPRAVFILTVRDSLRPEVKNELVARGHDNIIEFDMNGLMYRYIAT